MTDIDKNEQALFDMMQRKVDSRADANWKQLSDVDYGDLEFFLAQARRKKTAADFDMALDILKALKQQVTQT